MARLSFLFVFPDNEPVLQKFYGLCAAKFAAFDFRCGIVLKFGDDGGPYGFFDNDSTLCVF